MTPRERVQNGLLNIFIRYPELADMLCLLPKEKRYQERTRLRGLAAYGGKCTCCGEDELGFLTLEHLNNDGREHRKRVGRNRVQVWRDVERQGYPTDKYTILCWNCNMSKRRGRACIHTYPKIFRWKCQ
jgi:hypothetical protein